MFSNASYLIERLIYVRAHVYQEKINEEITVSV